MKNKCGEGCITPCIIILSIFMLLSTVLSFAGAVQMTQLSKKTVGICLDSFVMENARTIYDSIKNGDNALEGLDTEGFTEDLIPASSLVQRGNMLYRTDGSGRDIFWISAPALECTDSGKLVISASYTAHIPLYFCGVEMGIAEVPIRVESKYNNIF